MSEPLYPVPNFVDDPLTNPGSWQFVRKSDVSFDLDAGPWWIFDLGGSLTLVAINLIMTSLIVTLVVTGDQSTNQLGGKSL